MAQHEHKLFTTPVSVNDGFKRSDSRTWTVLAITVAVAIVSVVLIELFVPKPTIHWPASSARPQAVPSSQAEPDEPRTYDVAPRGSAPGPSPRQR